MNLDGWQLGSVYTYKITVTWSAADPFVLHKLCMRSMLVQHCGTKHVSAVHEILEQCAMTCSTGSLLPLNTGNLVLLNHQQYWEHPSPS